MEEASYITETELNALGDEEGLVVIVFTAAWCGPCQVVAPDIDRLASEYNTRAKVVKFDVDSNREVLRRFGLRGIPAVLFFRAGTLVDSAIGVTEYARLQAIVETALSGVLE